MTNETRTPMGLQPGSEVWRIAFVREASAGQTIVHEFPAPMNRRAVLLANGVDAIVDTGTPAEVQLLSVVEAAPENPDQIARMKDWVDAATIGSTVPSILVTLHGVQIIWTSGRVAICTIAERMESVRKTVIEAIFHELELQSVERDLAQRWQQLEADSPLAFQFAEKSVSKREQLGKRFQEIVGLRARQAKLNPFVLSPHVHPPTLASQIAERLRERTRMHARLEILGEQLEVFENVYESCGQRASDFMLNRSSLKLEWIIIILLLTQIVIIVFEIMMAMGK